MAKLSQIIQACAKWYHTYPYQTEADGDLIQPEGKKKHTQRGQCEGRGRDWVIWP